MQKFDEIKILGVVITYYPNIEETKRNIEQFIEDIDLLIIWENTPLAERTQYKIELTGYEDKIIYKGTDLNMFIAYPLNQAVSYGRENGFTHILTMDQDSFFEVNHFVKYKGIACSFNNMAIFGPNPNYYDFDQTDSPVEKPFLITSGSIINLKLFDKVGLYREDYNIDCVDYEFCFKAKSKGYKCYMIGSILLKQEFGKLEKTKYGYYNSNYPPLRLYHICRNNIWLFQQYPKYINLTTVFSRIIKPFIKIIISEDNKIMKLKAIFNGVSAGLFHKK